MNGHPVIGFDFANFRRDDLLREAAERRIVADAHRDRGSVGAMRRRVGDALVRVGERLQAVTDLRADAFVLGPGRDAPERVAAADVHPDRDRASVECLAPRTAPRAVHQDVIEGVVSSPPRHREELAHRRYGRAAGW